MTATCKSFDNCTILVQVGSGRQRQQPQALTVSGGQAQEESAGVMHQPPWRVEDQEAKTASGAPVIIGGVMSILDMSTTVLSYGAPELALLSAGMTNNAQYLRLPVFSTGGCSDSKTLDQQAAIEGALYLAFAALSGANLIHDVGYLESGLCGFYDMLVMSNETISMVKRLLRGVPVDAGHLALDAIERVGPGGHYLMDDHTMKYFRTEFWVPELLDRTNWTTWHAKGATSLRARVHQNVRDLVEHYEPVPVFAAAEQELARLVARADEAHQSEEKVKLV